MPFVRGPAIVHFYRSQVRTGDLVDKLIVEVRRQTTHVLALFYDEPG